MAQVFHFNSDSEKEGLEKQIQFLYDNKLITKVTKFKQVAKKVFAVANFILKN